MYWYSLAFLSNTSNLILILKATEQTKRYCVIPTKHTILNVILRLIQRPNNLIMTKNRLSLKENQQLHQVYLFLQVSLPRHFKIMLDIREILSKNVSTDYE